MQTFIEHLFIGSSTECEKKNVDMYVAGLESFPRDLSHIFVHVDMDMFYAAVHIRDDNLCRYTPIAISNRKAHKSSGIIMCPNYVARSRGVKARMPNLDAKGKCNLKIIRAYRKSRLKYTTAMNQVLNVLEKYDPNYYRLDSDKDDAHLDITPYVLHKYFESTGNVLEQPTNPSFEVLPEAVWTLAYDIVHEMRHEVKTITKLTCSAGISHSRMLAKLCGKRSKMNGIDAQFISAISLDMIRTLLEESSVSTIDGVSDAIEMHLNALDIDTCKDLHDNRHLSPLCLPDYVNNVRKIYYSYIVDILGILTDCEKPKYIFLHGDTQDHSSRLR